MSGQIVVRSLRKQFPKVLAVAGVDLDVAAGEVFGLLGPNGAGKTTCFYSVMGLVKPDSGRIFLDGQDITGLPMYRRAVLGLGYLPQETSIFRGMTVEQNILSVLEIAEPDREGGVLRYRGIDIEELVGKVPFENVWGLPRLNAAQTATPLPIS